MSTQIRKSNAFVTFISGDHLKDIQILINDRELFNSLPGKFERHGIKTLASSPMFVTAVLNEGQLHQAEYAADNPHRLSVREAAASYTQIPIFDMTTTAKPTGIKARRRKVEKTLAEIRKLHEDLNSELYSHPTERPKIQSPGDAFSIMQSFLGPLEHEELWVLGLDTRNRVLTLTKLYQGSLNSSQVRIGEIFKRAILDNAASIVIAHNHPSGEATPSPDDISVTRAIIQAGKLVDIPVLDHIVVARESYVSLKERGLAFS